MGETISPNRRGGEDGHRASGPAPRRGSLDYREVPPELEPPEPDPPELPVPPELPDPVPVPVFPVVSDPPVPDVPELPDIPELFGIAEEPDVPVALDPELRDELEPEPPVAPRVDAPGLEPPAPDPVEPDPVEPEPLVCANAPPLKTSASIATEAKRARFIFPDLPVDDRAAAQYSGHAADRDRYS